MSSSDLSKVLRIDPPQSSTLYRQLELRQRPIQDRGPRRGRPARDGPRSQTPRRTPALGDVRSYPPQAAGFRGSPARAPAGIDFSVMSNPANPPLREAARPRCRRRGRRDRDDPRPARSGRRSRRRHRPGAQRRVRLPPDDRPRAVRLRPGPPLRARADRPPRRRRADRGRAGLGRPRRSASFTRPTSASSPTTRSCWLWEGRITPALHPLRDDRRPPHGRGAAWADPGCRGRLCRQRRLCRAATDGVALPAVRAGPDDRRAGLSTWGSSSSDGHHLRGQPAGDLRRRGQPRRRRAARGGADQDDQLRLRRGPRAREARDQPRRPQDARQADRRAARALRPLGARASPSPTMASSASTASAGSPTPGPSSPPGTRSTSPSSRAASAPSRPTSVAESIAALAGVAIEPAALQAGRSTGCS